MAFLDNSGDIILDAVLTDTGRYRLAKGDGSFKIVKFALGDDEIDYSLYDKNNPSGSVYYDLSILQTPVLEALTDNASALKSHLLTINQTDLLFLPVIKIDETDTNARTFQNSGFYAVVADETTEKTAPFNTAQVPAGTFFTATAGATDANRIVLHQGLDTNQLSPAQTLSPDLVESMYMIELDNRLGFVKMGNTVLQPSYIDDDQVATYLVTQQRNPNMVANIPVVSATNPANSQIRGPRGTSLSFQLAASQELQTSTYLFGQLGFVSGSFTVIDSIIKVTGATTGYKIDIPVRFYKAN